MTQTITSKLRSAKANLEFWESREHIILFHLEISLSKEQ